MASSALLTTFPSRATTTTARRPSPLSGSRTGSQHSGKFRVQAVTIGCREDSHYSREIFVCCKV